MLSEHSEFIPAGRTGGLFSERSMVFSKSYADAAFWSFFAAEKGLGPSGYEDGKPCG